eukprot:1143562-Rhodomonas_salina.2
MAVLRVSRSLKVESSDSFPSSLVQIYPHLSTTMRFPWYHNAFPLVQIYPDVSTTRSQALVPACDQYCHRRAGTLRPAHRHTGTLRLVLAQSEQAGIPIRNVSTGHRVSLA